LPLFEKARIEVYLPDLDKPGYAELLEELDSEFTFSFRGCTLARGFSGSYLSRLGIVMRDPINVLYTDVPLALSASFQVLSDYTDELRTAAFRALNEEAILVVVYPVYHSQ
jgi:hypothetical protein